MSDGEYFGAQAAFNVWRPYVESQSEFSLSQMWLASGTYGNDLNTIEAGWHVSSYSHYLLHSFFSFFDLPNMFNNNIFVSLH